MKLISKLAALAGAALVMGVIGHAAPASAQAVRTWVSGVGDDANPCSRTAPCKTFAGAISKTAAGGEINCLDPGGFGAVTITKSITIACSGGIAGIAASGTTGIIVNAGASDVVVIDGLYIEGYGTGVHGIRFIAGAALVVRNTSIAGFNNSGGGNGILFAPGAAAELYVFDSTIADNGGNNGTGYGSGIEVAPTAGGSAKVVLRNVEIVNNGNNGLRLNTTSTTAAAGINASLDQVEISGSAQGMIAFSPNGTAAVAMATNSSFSGNTGFGILTAGAGARVRVGSSIITGNATGVQGTVNTYGNNQLGGNTADGTFVSPKLDLL